MALLVKSLPSSFKARRTLLVGPKEKARVEEKRKLEWRRLETMDEDKRLY